MRLGLIQRADGLVDLLAPHRGRGLEPVGGGEFGARGGLGGEEVAEEDVAIGQGLLYDEGVVGMVVHWIGEGCRFGGALCGMVISGGLNGPA